MRKALEQQTVPIGIHYDRETGATLDGDRIINEMLKRGWEYHGTPVYALLVDGMEKKSACQVMVRYEDS